MRATYGTVLIPKYTTGMVMFPPRLRAPSISELTRSERGMFMVLPDGTFMVPSICVYGEYKKAASSGGFSFPLTGYRSYSSEPAMTRLAIPVTLPV